jgi:hypothetical protein
VRGAGDGLRDAARLVLHVNDRGEEAGGRRGDEVGRRDEPSDNLAVVLERDFRDYSIDCCDDFFFIIFRDFRDCSIIVVIILIDCENFVIVVPYPNFRNSKEITCKSLLLMSD